MIRPIPIKLDRGRITSHKVGRIRSKLDKDRIECDEVNNDRYGRIESEKVNNNR